MEKNPVISVWRRVGDSMGRHPSWLLAVVSAAFALLLASIWSARNGAAGQPDSVVNFARLVKVATCFGVAWTFKSHLPPVRTLFVSGTALVGVHLVLGFGLTLLPTTAPPPRTP